MSRSLSDILSYNGLDSAVSGTAKEWLDALQSKYPDAIGGLSSIRLVAAITPEDLKSQSDLEIPPSTGWIRGSFIVHESNGDLLLAGSGGIGVLYAVTELENVLMTGRGMAGIQLLREPQFGNRIIGRDELYLNPGMAWQRPSFLEAAIKHGFDMVELPWYSFRPDHIEATLPHLQQLERFDLDACIEGELFQHLPDVPEEARGVSRLSSGHFSHPACLSHAWTRDYFTRFLKEISKQPRIKKMLWYFFDVAHLCTSECPRCGDKTAVDRIIEFTAWCQEVVDQWRSDLRIYLRTWHLMPEEREYINANLPDRIGVDTKMSNAGDEIYIPIPRFSDCYGPHEEALVRRYKKRVLSELPIGNCESIDSATGIPLLQLTARRLETLASWGGPSIRNWWGFCEEVYNPNYELARECFFNTAERADEIIKRIAVRDFGADQSDRVILFWKQAEIFITSWPIVSWMQRLETFKDRAYGAIDKPCLIPVRPEPFVQMLSEWILLKPTSREFTRLVPRELEAEGRFKEHPLDWITERLLEKYQDIVTGLDKILNDGERIGECLAGAPAQRMSQQVHSLGYFRCLLHSQYAFYRALLLTHEKKRTHLPQRKFQFDEQMAVLVDQEIANNEMLIRFMESDSSGVMAHFDIDGKRPFQQERPLLPGQLKAITAKLDSMKEWAQKWEAGSESGVPYAPYISIDKRLYRWGDPDLKKIRFGKQTKLGLWESRESAGWLFRDS